MIWEKGINRGTKGWTFGVAKESNVVGYMRKDDEWRVVWLGVHMLEIDDDYLPTDAFTEEELREALILKYKLMGGKDE